MPTIAELKNCRTAGPDGIPPEVYKYGGSRLAETVLKYCLACWEEGDIPAHWKRLKFNPSYKRKGDKSECSLLDAASKIFAKIFLARFNKHIANKILPESQCGFKDKQFISVLYVLINPIYSTIHLLK